jgi:hypothetical protein
MSVVDQAHATAEVPSELGRHLLTSEHEPIRGDCGRWQLHDGRLAGGWGAIGKSAVSSKVS